MLTIYSKPDRDVDHLTPVASEARSVAAPVLVNVPEEPQSVSEYIRQLERHWPLLAWSGAAGCFLGLLLALVQTPTYRAKTSIEIQNINGDFMNMKQTHPVSDDAEGVDALMDLQTQIEVLQSASLSEAAKRAMKQAGLKEQWAAEHSAIGALVGHGKGDLNDRVLDKVAESARVRAVGQTRMIQVQVDAPNPALAADFANTLVAEYIHENIRARAQMTEAAEDATRGQLVEMRKKVESSEHALQQYAARNGLHFTAERETISDEGLRQVQTDLLHARTDLIEKQARHELAESARVDSLADVEKDPDLRELRSKLVDLQRQEADLLTVYKPDYSEVQKLKAQAAQTESALEQARARVVGRVNDEYKESGQKEKLLTSAYQGALEKAANDSQVAVQYEILKREADANLSAYQDMLAKVKELGLAAAFRTSNVRVVDPAQAPTHQHSPQLLLNLVLGIFSGLGLGIGYVVVAERSDPSLRHPGEASSRLGIPELATIPKLVSESGNYVALPPPGAGAELEGGLTVIRDHSMNDGQRSLDAFRTLLTSIIFGGVNGQSPKVIVITSTEAQDGKTTVASNLAIALARAGKSVLLVDGDLRNPALHRRFSLQNVIGLGNLLQAGCDESDAQFAVLQTSITRLNVLPSGSFTAAPADLLFQANLHRIMNVYRDHFDMIVVDSPPLNGLPDARLLGRAADCVVLVARANKTSRSALVTACNRLIRDRSRLLGVVLNDWEGKTSPYPA